MPSQPRGAGVLEDDRSVARAVLVEGDAFMGMTEKLLQEALALLDWRAPQVLAIEFEEVERAEHGGGIMTVPRIRSKTASPLSSQTTASPSSRQERTGSTVTAATIWGNRFAKFVPFSGQQLDTAVGAPGHDAEAVVLDLVNPAATFGRLLGRAGKTRLDEGCQVGRRTLTQHGRLITATVPESSQGCFSSSGSLAKFTANAAPRYGSADCGPRLLRRTGAATRRVRWRVFCS